MLMWLKANKHTGRMINKALIHTIGAFFVNKLAVLKNVTLIKAKKSNTFSVEDKCTNYCNDL